MIGRGPYGPKYCSSREVACLVYTRPSRVGLHQAGDPGPTLEVRPVRHPLEVPGAVGEVGAGLAKGVLQARVHVAGIGRQGCKSREMSNLAQKKFSHFYPKSAQSRPTLSPSWIEPAGPRPCRILAQRRRIFPNFGMNKIAIKEFFVSFAF